MKSAPVTQIRAQTHFIALVQLNFWYANDTDHELGKTLAQEVRFHQAGRDISKRTSTDSPLSHGDLTEAKPQRGPILSQLWTDGLITVQNEHEDTPYILVIAACTPEACFLTPSLAASTRCAAEVKSQRSTKIRLVSHHIQHSRPLSAICVMNGYILDSGIYLLE